MPIYVDDIINWITGRSLPPRHSEGLNDPLSIAALFHFALIAQERDDDAITRSTLGILRTLLDDREAAETWGRDDLVRFGSAFKEAQRALRAPYPAPTFLAVAERLQEAHRALDVAPTAGQTVSTIDGRALTVDPTSFGTVWLLASHLPLALVTAGLTVEAIPSFVCLPRYLTLPVQELGGVIEMMLGRAAWEGLAELDRLEARVKLVASDASVTRRSRLPDLLRLDLAYPGLRVAAVARLLGVTPQGAAKLVAQLRHAKARMRSPVMERG